MGCVYAMLEKAPFVLKCWQLQFDRKNIKIASQSTKKMFPFLELFLFAMENHLKKLVKDWQNKHKNHNLQWLFFLLQIPFLKLIVIMLDLGKKVKSDKNTNDVWILSLTYCILSQDLKENKIIICVTWTKIIFERKKNVKNIDLL